MPLFFLLIFNILWLTGYNSYNLNSNLDDLSKNFVNLGFKYTTEEALKTMSNFFTATNPTMYMIIMNNAGSHMIIGYCYGGNNQDNYGAQLRLSLEGIKFRKLSGGTWSDWISLT